MNVTVAGFIDAVLLISGLFVLIQAWRLRRKRVTLGPAAGAMYHEIMNDAQRKAVQIIVDEKTAYHDPEDADGNLPDLAKTRKAGTGQPVLKR